MNNQNETIFADDHGPLPEGEALLRLFGDRRPGGYCFESVLLPEIGCGKEYELKQRMEESPDVVRRLFLLTDHWEHLGILKHDMLVFDTEAEAEPGNLVKTDISDESPLRQLVARDGKYALIFPGDEKDEPIEAESINDLPILCVLKHVLRHMTDESKIAEAVRNSSHDGTGFQN